MLCIINIRIYFYVLLISDIFLCLIFNLTYIYFYDILPVWITGNVPQLFSHKFFHNLLRIINPKVL